MSPYSLPPLISAVLFAALGLYVYAQNTQASVNRMYAFGCFLTFFWQATWTVLFNIEDAGAAKLLAKIGYSGIIFLPMVFYHFIANLLDRAAREKNFLRILYGIGFFFLIFLWASSSFVNGVHRHAWGSYPKAGIPLHPLFLVFLAFLGVRAPLLIYREMKKPDISDIRRNQLKYVFLALIAYLSAASDFAVNYGASFYPLGVLAILVSFGIITNAIVKYRLMAISVFVRKTVLITCVYFILAACLTPLIFLMNAQIKSHPENSVFILILGFLLATAGATMGPLLYALIVKRNSYFHEETLAGLAHELKGPLAAIEGALTILNDQNGRNQHRGNARKRSDYLEMIQRNSEKLRKSVGQLLAVFNRDGEHNLSSEKVDLGKLCHTVLEQYESALSMKKLSISGPSLSPTAVQCDAEKISQVISNLLSNAVKFTDHGHISLVVSRQNGDMMVSVEDTGPGISSDELPFVFDRFFQGQTGRLKKGTGIGLTIAKAWVEAHGGKIWAESEGEGKGTTVRFTLPV